MGFYTISTGAALVSSTVCIAMWFPGMLVGMHSSLSSDRMAQRKSFWAHQMLGVILTCASSEPEISYTSWWLQPLWKNIWNHHQVYSCFPPQSQPSFPPSVASSWCKLHCGSAPSLHPPIKLPLTQTFGTLLELVFSVNSLLKNVGKIRIRARSKGVEKIDEILKVRHQLSIITYNHWPQWATTNSKGKGYLGESLPSASKWLEIMPIVTPLTANLHLQPTPTTSLLGRKKTPTLHLSNSQEEIKGTSSAPRAPCKKKHEKTTFSFLGIRDPWYHMDPNMVLWYTQSPCHFGMAPKKWSCSLTPPNNPQVTHGRKKKNGLISE